MIRLFLLCFLIAFSLIAENSDISAINSLIGNTITNLQHHTLSNAAQVPLAKFQTTIARFKQEQQKKLKNNAWFEDYNPFLDSTKVSTFKPFAQKTIIPANSKIAFFGDLHGNAAGLHRILEYLQEKQLINNHGVIIDLSFYMIFLGDYVDRGDCGAEVINTLLTLKNNNPNQIFLVRGNHEDAQINEHYGFMDELIHKYGKQITGRNHSIAPSTFNFVYEIYDYMPAVLYVGIENQHGGIDYIHCCHGGLELGYNPQDFLTSQPEYHAVSCIRTKEFQQLSIRLKKKIKSVLPRNCNYIVDSHNPETPTSTCCLGLMWADFDADNQGTRYIEGRDLVYGQTLTKFLLTRQSSNDAKLCAIFRAHQHHGTMLDNLKLTKGIAPLFDNLVYTFLSVPLDRTGFNFDSIGILHIGDSYQHSHLEHHVIRE